MSSKLPLPVFYRRDWKSLSPSDRKEGDKSPPSNESEDKKTTKKSKYANIQPKVKTHWSVEEKNRNGLKDFFERKSGSSSANTSTTTSPNQSFKTMRLPRHSLPMPLPSDPIAVAIAQIKRNTHFYSFSETASTASSVSSLVNCVEEN